MSEKRVNPTNDSDKKVLLAFAIVALIAASYFCFSSVPDNNTEPTPRPAQVRTEQAILVCPECEDAGMEITIWRSPSRSGVAGSVPHGSRVTIMDTQSYDGVRHYEIRYGGVRGWVSHLFVEK